MSLADVTNLDATLLVTLVTLIVSLTKIIEILVKKVSPNKKVLSDEEFERLKNLDFKLKNLHTQINDKPTLSDTQDSMLQDLYNWHNKTDADGIPLWYVPRSFIESQKEIVDVLSDISKHQEKTTFLLEALIKRIERLEDKLDSRFNKNEE